MSKQVMQKALEALTLARSQLDVLWVSHHANRTDAALASSDAAIAELRAAIAAQDNKLHDQTNGAMAKGGAGGPGHIELHTHPNVYSVMRGGGGGGGAGPAMSKAEMFHPATNPAFALGGSGSAPPDTEAMRRDAERYRWLAQNHGWMLLKHFPATRPYVDATEVVGESIDAAIAAQRGGG